MAEPRETLIASKVNVFGQIYNRTVTRPMIEAYISSLRDLTNAELELGFSEALKRCKYFPTPSEVRDAMMVALERMPRQVLARQDCEVCSGSGWKLIEKDGRRWATQCSCRKVVNE